MGHLAVLRQTPSSWASTPVPGRSSGPLGRQPYPLARVGKPGQSSGLSWAQQTSPVTTEGVSVRVLAQAFLNLLCNPGALTLWKFNHVQVKLYEVVQPSHTSGFASHCVSDLQSSKGQKQTSLLLTYGQKVGGSLLLCHRTTIPPLTSSHCAGT